jgi:predicted nucleic acid-binding protein
MPEYIFNTTVLSNFASVNRPDLLEILYRDIAFTTLEISDELYRGIKAGYSYLNNALQQIITVNPKGWLSVLTPESSAEYHLRYEFDQTLDPGEASCLALAVSRKLIFITDDLAARRLAQQKNVSLTGTVGILIRLVRNKTLALDDANAILKVMIQKHYRSPVNRLDELI